LFHIQNIYGVPENIEVDEQQEDEPVQVQTADLDVGSPVHDRRQSRDDAHDPQAQEHHEHDGDQEIVRDFQGSLLSAAQSVCRIIPRGSGTGR
jgi:hypothetical protein